MASFLKRNRSANFMDWNVRVAPVCLQLHHPIRVFETIETKYTSTAASCRVNNVKWKAYIYIFISSHLETFTNYEQSVVNKIVTYHHGEQRRFSASSRWSMSPDLDVTVASLNSWWIESCCVVFLFFFCFFSLFFSNCWYTFFKYHESLTRSHRSTFVQKCGGRHHVRHFCKAQQTLVIWLSETYLPFRQDKHHVFLQTQGSDVQCSMKGIADLWKNGGSSSWKSTGVSVYCRCVVV